MPNSLVMEKGFDCTHLLSSEFYLNKLPEKITQILSSIDKKRHYTTQTIFRSIGNVEKDRFNSSI